MGIVVELRPGATVSEASEEGFCPLVRCDQCGSPIRRAADGFAVWHRLEERGRHLAFLHEPCVEAFERAHDDDDLKALELDRFLARLGAHLEVDPGAAPPGAGESPGRAGG